MNSIASSHKDMLVKLQALARGFLVRQRRAQNPNFRMKNGMSELEQKIVSSRSRGEFRGGMPARHESHSNGLVYAKQLQEMPDYSNEATNATEKMLGPFEYDQDEESHYGTDLITRGPYALDNGAIYEG